MEQSEPVWMGKQGRRLQTVGSAHSREEGSQGLSPLSFSCGARPQAGARAGGEEVSRSVEQLPARNPGQRAA